jgi:hypothetical protein
MNNTIRVITKLPNAGQSYKVKVKTHIYINRQSQSTTGKLLYWQPEPSNNDESGRFSALKSDSTHHFFRNVCTKSGSLRFSQFAGCWLTLSVYIKQYNDMNSTIAWTIQCHEQYNSMNSTMVWTVQYHEQYNTMNSTINMNSTIPSILQ